MHCVFIFLQQWAVRLDVLRAAAVFQAEPEIKAEAEFLLRHFRSKSLTELLYYCRDLVAWEKHKQHDFATKDKPYSGQMRRQHFVNRMAHITAQSNVLALASSSSSLSSNDQLITGPF